MSKNTTSMMETYTIDFNKIEQLASVLSRQDSELAVNIVAQSNQDLLTSENYAKVSTQGSYFLDMLTLTQHSQNSAFKTFYERLNKKGAEEFNSEERKSFLEELTSSLEVVSKMPKLVKTPRGASKESILPKFEMVVNADGSISDETRNFLTKLSKLENEYKQPYSIIAEAALELANPTSNISSIKTKIDERLKEFKVNSLEQTEKDIIRNGIQIRTPAGETMDFLSVKGLEDWAENTGLLTKEQVGFITSMADQGVMVGAGIDALTSHRTDFGACDKTLVASKLEPAILVEIEGDKVQLSSHIRWYEVMSHVEKVSSTNNPELLPDTDAISTISADISGLKADSFNPTLTSEKIKFSYILTSLNTDIFRLNVPEMIKGDAITPAEHLKIYGAAKVKRVAQDSPKDRQLEAIKEIPTFLKLPVTSQLLKEGKLSIPREELVGFVQDTTKEMLKAIATKGNYITNGDIKLIAEQTKDILNVAGYDTSNLKTNRFIIACAAEEKVDVRGHFWDKTKNWFSKNIMRKTNEQILFNKRDVRNVIPIVSPEKSLSNRNQITPDLKRAARVTKMRDSLPVSDQVSSNLSENVSSKPISPPPTPKSKSNNDGAARGT